MDDKEQGASTRGHEIGTRHFGREPSYREVCGLSAGASDREPFLGGIVDGV